MREKHWTWAAATWAAGAATILGLALLLQRIGAVVSFAEPMHVITSGWEQGPLLTIWKVMHGEPVFHDRHLFPFDVTVFNWLFYHLYGLLSGLVLAGWSLDDAWIPTIGRLLTLSGAVVGVTACVALFRQVLGPEGSGRVGGLTWLSALFVMTGPLIGWWAVTVRPDVWAMALEAVAAWLFWHGWRRGRPAWGALAAAVPLYMAWSCKQTAITILIGLGLFLLAKRQWRGVAALAAGFALPVAVTFAVGGPVYVNSLLMRDYPMDYSLAHALGVAANAGVKTLAPLGACLVATLVAALVPEVRRRALADERLALAGLCSAAGLGVAGLTSLQTGSAENYYFTASVFITLTSLIGLDVVRQCAPARASGMATLGVGAAWLVQALAVGAVLVGLAGARPGDLASGHGGLVAAKRCLDGLPRPLYVDNDYLSLPWMTPDNPPFVKPFPYGMERAMGRWFERGGIGGLVGEGWFAAIVVPGVDAPPAVDGAALERYRSAPELCPGWVVLLRR